MERSAAEASGTSSGPSYKDVTSFAALPVGECILQLCNLADDYIQSVIDKPAQLETCSLKSGSPPLVFSIIHTSQDDCSVHAWLVF